MGATESVQQQINRHQVQLQTRINGTQIQINRLKVEHANHTRELKKIGGSVGASGATEKQKRDLRICAKKILLNEEQEHKYNGLIETCELLKAQLITVQHNNDLTSSMQQVNSLIVDINSVINGGDISQLQSDFQHNMTSLMITNENAKMSMEGSVANFDQNADDMIQNILDVNEVRVKLSAPVIPQQQQQQSPQQPQIINLMDGGGSSDNNSLSALEQQLSQTFAPPSPAKE